MHSLIKVVTGLYLIFCLQTQAQAQQEISMRVNTSIPTQSEEFYSPHHNNIQYIGRFEKSTKSLIRVWMPGAYMNFKFEGTFCKVYLNDEVLYGTTHNYISIIVDGGNPQRIQTNGPQNTISISGLKNGVHTITICKDTEAGNGYLEFAGLECKNLSQPDPLPSLKMEFIGNSITCGFGADASIIACDQGQWYDQHNAYRSYGAITARAFNAQWNLSSVSGIGLIHSCCNMSVTMPQVWDNINMREDSLSWNFNQYIPDLVTICLGQNDGIQDSTTFCNSYIQFINKVRAQYKIASILLLTSPMGDSSLTSVLKKYLGSIVTFLNLKGDKKINSYFFKARYHSGCGAHPSIEEQQEIANELITFIHSNPHLLPRKE